MTANTSQVIGAWFSIALGRVTGWSFSVDWVNLSLLRQLLQARLSWPSLGVVCGHCKFLASSINITIILAPAWVSTGSPYSAHHRQGRLRIFSYLIQFVAGYKVQNHNFNVFMLQFVSYRKCTVGLQVVLSSLQKWNSPRTLGLYRTTSQLPRVQVSHMSWVSK